jgi:hypothetical protein
VVSDVCHACAESVLRGDAPYGYVKGLSGEKFFGASAKR